MAVTPRGTPPSTPFGSAQYGGNDWSDEGANALISGGGVSANASGQASNPNALPLWDPYNHKTGYGTAYLNLLGMPSQAGAAMNGQLAGAIGADIGARNTQRYIPGQAENNQTRAMQMAQLPGVQMAGADLANAQRGMVADAYSRGQPAATMQNALVQGGGTVGAGNAAGQNALASMLMGQAAGTSGPSAAQAVLQQGLSRATGAMGGVAANTRGSNAAAAARNAALVGQNMGMETQAQAAQLRAQEQQAAQQTLGNVLGTARQQDIQRYAEQGAQANAARAGALGEAMGAAQIAQGARGQDIDTAMGAAGVLQGMRGQDLGAGQLGLQARQLDDAQRQAALANGLNLFQLQQQGGQLDADMLLRAAGFMGDYNIGRRNSDTNRQNANTAETDSTLDFIGGLTAAGGATAGRLIKPV